MRRRTFVVSLGLVSANAIALAQADAGAPVAAVHSNDSHVATGHAPVAGPSNDSHAPAAHSATALSSNDSHAASHASPSPHSRKPVKPGKGVLHAVRFGEDFTIRLRDARGRIPDGALTEFSRLARQNGTVVPPDPRLVALIGQVSDHFAGRTFEVVSGYRAYKPTQYTRRSKHNLGRALDFRIEGVSNESVRDFCRTLKNAGCGYYPNSTFVHVDARETKAYWVDLSRPGEAPIYEKSGNPADEGASEVLDDHLASADRAGAGDSPSDRTASDRAAPEDAMGRRPASSDSAAEPTSPGDSLERASSRNGTSEITRLRTVEDSEKSL